MIADPPAGPLAYLRYVLFHAVGLLMAAALVAGGMWITVALVGVVVAYVVGDAVVGDDLSTPQFTRPGWLTAQLWMALPLLAIIVFIAVWSASPGDHWALVLPFRRSPATTPWRRARPRAGATASRLCC